MERDCEMRLLGVAIRGGLHKSDKKDKSRSAWFPLIDVVQEMTMAMDGSR